MSENDNSKSDISFYQIHKDKSESAIYLNKNIKLNLLTGEK